MSSPYTGLPPAMWRAKTEELVADHPLGGEELAEITLSSWAQILETKIGGRLQIGVDAMMSPQMMGNFLHALIPVELGIRYPSIWRKEAIRTEKDLVYVPNDMYSVEIKTSSAAKDIYANRSYAQPSGVGAKGKDGYYLAINTDKMDPSTPRPTIRRIAFGWLDHTDWIPQASPTGQQARLTVEAKASKFIEFYIKGQ